MEKKDKYFLLVGAMGGAKTVCAMKLKFKFFRDKNGRLRVTLYPFGITKPAERVCDGKPIGERHRYNLLKVFGLRGRLSMEDAYRLASADDGDEVEVEIGGV